MALAQINGASTAWMLVATALVLLMTPALALFYVGLVRSKNALNTFMMSLSALGVVTVAFALVGYSIAFDEGNALFGGLGLVALDGVGFAAREGTEIPHLLFFCFQASFCILTTALVSGAVVERMRFGAYLVFAVLWSILVYAVLAHWIWGGGWLQEGGALDFAGGVPVEMASGFSAVAAAIVVGARSDYGRAALLPHNALFALLGAGLLWFGWFGFNGGSGFGINDAGMLAFVNTLLAPACTLVVWMLIDLARDRRITAIGAATAVVVGCVGITPACGFVSPPAAMLLGALAAIPSYIIIVWRPDAAGRDARRARRARHRGPRRDPVHRVLRAGVVERRRRRAAVRERRAAVVADARRARRADLRVRDDVRDPQGDRPRHAAARDDARGGARHGRRPARRGGVHERRGRDPRHERLRGAVRAARDDRVRRATAGGASSARCGGRAR
jgi:Amt family ammonium transporter